MTMNTTYTTSCVLPKSFELKQLNAKVIINRNVFFKGSIRALYIKEQQFLGLRFIQEGTCLLPTSPRCHDHVEKVQVNSFSVNEW